MQGRHEGRSRVYGICQAAETPDRVDGSTFFSRKVDNGEAAQVLPVAEAGQQWPCGTEPAWGCRAWGYRACYRRALGRIARDGQASSRQAPSRQAPSRQSKPSIAARAATSRRRGKGAACRPNSHGATGAKGSRGWVENARRRRPGRCPRQSPFQHRHVARQGTHTQDVARGEC